jgi:hypothetical protein
LPWCLTAYKDNSGFGITRKILQFYKGPAVILIRVNVKLSHQIPAFYKDHEHFLYSSGVSTVNMNFRHVLFPLYISSTIATFYTKKYYYFFSIRKPGGRQKKTSSWWARGLVFRIYLGLKAISV